ncbi:MAG: sulfite exporter TauE/SafE family protein [Micrococcales bacterium]|nr:sulfite exporter TauE/SafE family protein [Micrococcales bacterium]
MTLVWIVPLGLAVGIVLGALGGGGAILTVPILVYVLAQTPSAATTGSLVIVALISLVGLLPHHRVGNVRMRDGLVFGVLGVVGSLVGSRLNAAVPAPILMTAFAALMLVVAILMTVKRRGSAGRRVVGDDGKSAAPSDEAGHRGWGVLIGAATGVGLLTGFFGVGGGFAVVPALVLVLGFSMPVAVGTSLLVIVINSLTALLGRLGTGLEIDWPLILAFSVFGAAGSLLGGRIAQRVDPQRLSLAFTILLVLVAAYVALQSVPQLLG